MQRETRKEELGQGKMKHTSLLFYKKKAAQRFTKSVLKQNTSKFVFTNKAQNRKMQFSREANPNLAV